uniref:Uncharacterized protein n=1 Tax=Siphoviridae sp. ctiOl67 TaxID=2825622 RepID=A0A8S5QJQ2_9CAUD|nr:MAG TPA: hypothetical protein [Siphoviridae sp. ctiOl67]
MHQHHFPLSSRKLYTHLHQANNLFPCLNLFLIYTQI